MSERLSDKEFFAMAIIPALRKAVKRFGDGTTLDELFIAFVRGEITYDKVEFLSGEFLDNVIEYAEANAVEDGELGLVVMRHSEHAHPKFLGAHVDPHKYGFVRTDAHDPRASAWIRQVEQEEEEWWGYFEEEEMLRELIVADILAAAHAVVRHKADDFLEHLKDRHPHG